MTTFVAICRDSHNAIVPVHCKAWENWHGAADHERTAEQLLIDHPELTFEAWVESGIDSLRGNFLDANVLWVEVWIDTGTEFKKTRVYRHQVINITE
jgi:hypothetical protein